MKRGFAASIIIILCWFTVQKMIFVDSRIFKDEKIWEKITASKSAEVQALVESLEGGEIQPWISSAAPVLWWHADEKFKATDPQELLTTNVSLWYREIRYGFPLANIELTNLGAFDTRTFKNIKYKGFSPTDDVTRILERSSINEGLSGFEIHYDPFAQATKPAPLFWRISRHPMFQRIQNTNANEIIIPVEFWFHFTYNETGVLLGNHDGDWESMLFLFKVKINKDEIKATPFMIATSAHGRSTWHCEKNLSHSEARIELFNAVGTHATYETTGYHWRLPVLYTDRTERGSAWKTWQNIRPIVKEDFYGFSGSWGRTSYIHFQNAPLPPAPHLKFLPGDANVERSIENYLTKLRRCQN